MSSLHWSDDRLLILLSHCRITELSFELCQVLSKIKVGPSSLALLARASLMGLLHNFQRSVLGTCVHTLWIMVDV